MNFLKIYDRLLTKHPLTTKTISSGFLFAFGDYITQNYYEKKEYNIERTKNFAFVGVTFAPIIHFWYGSLNNFKILQKFTGFRKAFFMMILDQTVCAIPVQAYFILLCTYLNEKSVEKSKDALYRNYWNTLMANYQIWPAASLLNFFLIPIQYRVLFSNMVGLLWNCILSFHANRK